MTKTFSLDDVYGQPGQQPQKRQYSLDELYGEPASAPRMAPRPTTGPMPIARWNDVMSVPINVANAFTASNDEREARAALSREAENRAIAALGDKAFFNIAGVKVRNERAINPLKEQYLQEGLPALRNQFANRAASQQSVAADSVLDQIGAGLGQSWVGAVPVIGPMLLADQAGRETQGDLLNEGVDPRTAQNIGAGTGFGAGAGALLPASAPGGLVTRALSGAALNTGVGAVTRGGQQAALQDAGYQQQANARPGAFDPQSAATDALVGAFFGAATGGRPRVAEPQAAVPEVAPALPAPAPQRALPPPEARPTRTPREDARPIYEHTTTDTKTKTEVVTRYRFAGRDSQGRDLFQQIDAEGKPTKAKPRLAPKSDFVPVKDTLTDAPTTQVPGGDAPILIEGGLDENGRARRDGGAPNATYPRPGSVIAQPNQSYLAPDVVYDARTRTWIPGTPPSYGADGPTVSYGAGFDGEMDAYGQTFSTSEPGAYDPRVAGPISEVTPDQNPALQGARFQNPETAPGPARPAPAMGGDLAFDPQSRTWQPSQPPAADAQGVPSAPPRTTRNPGEEGRHRGVPPRPGYRAQREPQGPPPNVRSQGFSPDADEPRFGERRGAAPPPAGDPPPDVRNTAFEADDVADQPEAPGPAMQLRALERQVSAMEANATTPEQQSRAARARAGIEQARAALIGDTPEPGPLRPREADVAVVQRNGVDERPPSEAEGRVYRAQEAERRAETLRRRFLQSGSVKDKNAWTNAENEAELYRRMAADKGGETPTRVDPDQGMRAFEDLAGVKPPGREAPRRANLPLRSQRAGRAEATPEATARVRGTREQIARDEAAARGVSQPEPAPIGRRESPRGRMFEDAPPPRQTADLSDDELNARVRQMDAMINNDMVAPDNKVVARRMRDEAQTELDTRRSVQQPKPEPKGQTVKSKVDPEQMIAQRAAQIKKVRQSIQQLEADGAPRAKIKERERQLRRLEQAQEADEARRGGDDDNRPFDGGTLYSNPLDPELITRLLGLRKKQKEKGLNAREQREKAKLEKQKREADKAIPRDNSRIENISEVQKVARQKKARGEPLTNTEVEALRRYNEYSTEQRRLNQERRVRERANKLSANPIDEVFKAVREFLSDREGAVPPKATRSFVSAASKWAKSELAKDPMRARFWADLAAGRKRVTPKNALETTTNFFSLVTNSSVGALNQMARRYGAGVNDITRGVADRAGMRNVDLATKVDDYWAERMGIAVGENPIDAFARKVGTDPGSGKAQQQGYSERTKQLAGIWTNRISKSVIDLDVVTGRRIVELSVDGKLWSRLPDKRFDLPPGVDPGEWAKAVELRKWFDRVWQEATDAGLKLGKREGYFPRVLDEDMVRSNRDLFIRQATKAYKDTGMSQVEAAQAATEWFMAAAFPGTRSLMNPALVFDPAVSALNKRKLPASADVHMADFYVRDPATLTARYAERLAGEVAYTERFGQKGEKLEALAEFLATNVPEGDALVIMNQMMAATGQLTGAPLHPVLRTPLAMVDTLSMMMLLGRTAILQFLEPFNIAVRSNKDPINAAFMLVDQLRFFSSMPGFAKADNRSYKALAEMIGVTGAYARDMLVSSRLDGIDSALQRRMGALFMDAIGVTRLTEGQRAYAVQIGDTMFRHAVDDVVNGGSTKAVSQDLLREYGFDGADVKELKKFLDAIEKKTPDVRNSAIADAAPGSIADRYRSALYDFGARSIQEPNPAQVPYLAKNPIGRQAYALAGFMYTYTREIRNRAVKMFGRAAWEKMTPAERAKMANPLLTYAVMGAGAAAAANAVLEAAFGAREQEQDPTQKGISIASRMGLFGTWDPALNMLVFNARYERDPSTMALGPYRAQMVRNVVDMNRVMPWSERNSDKNNIAEWKAQRAVYRTFIGPAVATTMAAGAVNAPLKAAAMVGIPAVTSSRASAEYANATAGPKDDPRPPSRKTPAEQRADALRRARRRPPPPRRQ